MKTDHDRMYELLTILQSYAPKGSDQAYCAEQVNRMAADGMSLRTQAIYLARAIADGLAHGNWPWVIRDMNKTDIEAINEPPRMSPAAEQAGRDAMAAVMSPNWPNNRDGLYG